MVKSLTSWRGLFALSIFLEHANVFTDLGMVVPEYPVPFFFILSGFLLAKSKQYLLNEPCNIHTYLHYSAPRLIKIFPIHIIMLIAFFLLDGLTRYFPVNLFLLQSLIPNSNCYFSYNSVSWFLSDIFLFYLTFPILFRFLNRIKLRYKISSFVIIPLVLMALFSRMEDAQLRYYFSYICPFVRVLDFSLGIVLYDCYKILSDKDFIRNKATATICEVVALLLLVVCYIQVDIIYATYLSWIPVIYLILVFAVFSEQNGFVSRIISNKMFIKFGEISLYVYMIHFFVIRVTVNSGLAVSLCESYVLRTIIAFIITVILSVIAKWVLGRLSVRF